MKTICKLGLFGLMTVLPVTAQTVHVRVSNNSAYNPNEVSIAINPLNPDNIVVGSNLNYHYYSFDGGLSWTQQELASTYGVHGDPCVIFNNQGQCFYAHLANPPNGLGSWIDRIVVQRSDDGGAFWTSGVGIGLNPPRQEDKEWMAVDRSQSAYRDNLYVSWTEFDSYGSYSPADSSRILFSRSTDNGETWSVPMDISDHDGSCLDNDATVEGAVPTVGPNGEIYIAWSGPWGIVMDRSLNGGQSFGTDMPVADHYGGWAQNVDGINRCNGMPVTGCDISASPYNGRVYVSWSDYRNGDLDVFMTHSDDRGETWSGAVKVNTDNSLKDQFFPWMTVDPVTGGVYVVFYDRRRSDGEYTDVYVAASHDGGETFTDFCVSESPFDPTASKFFGDYINIAAYNGRVHPVWMRMEYSRLTIESAIVQDSAATTAVAAAAQPVNLELHANYPNPFNASTLIPFTLDRGQPVTLTVYNTLGRPVTTLVQDYLQPGQHTAAWHCQDLASGVYIIQLKTPTATRTMKCLLSQ